MWTCSFTFIGYALNQDIGHFKHVLNLHSAVNFNEDDDSDIYADKNQSVLSTYSVKYLAKITEGTRTIYVRSFYHILTPAC